MKKWQTVKMQVSELMPADYNPRDITEKALTGLGNSIERFGVVQPVVWNRRTGNVVGGHQRLKVLIANGETETDVVVVDFDANEEMALNLALNNPAIQGDFVSDKLGTLLENFETNSKELFDSLMMQDLTKFLDKEITGAEEFTPEQFDNFKHKCPRCGFEYDKDGKNEPA